MFFIQLKRTQPVIVGLVVISSVTNESLILEESGREVTAVRFDDDGIVAAELKAMVLGDAVSEKMRMAI